METVEKKHTGNIKGSKNPAQALSEDEIQSILNTLPRNKPAGIRNRAVILLMYRGMLRISEALNLRPADVDLDAGTVFVRKGKGGKSRTIGIPEVCVLAIEKWIDVRKAKSIKSGPLFCGYSKGKEGNPIDTSYYRHLMPRLAKKAGMDKRAHPHGCRHSGAVRLMDKGVNIGNISKGLGHSKITTTVRYLDHINPQAVIDAMREA